MTSDKPPVRDGAMDMDALKALAHPLRVKIVDLLSTYGAHTASGLAAHLGESSGATSYHLRQLEKHNFVREVEGKGTARERWWERVPGPISLDAGEVRQSPSAKTAARLIENEWANSRERLLRDFIALGSDLLSSEWQDASEVSVVNLTLTVDQLVAVNDRLRDVMNDAIAEYRGQRVTGARPVQLQIAAFPVVDGVETTAEDAS